MTLLTMTIPDHPAELSRWLERRLMAPDFGQFVAELSAHFPAAKSAPIRPLIDQWLPVALSDGLGSLPTEVLQKLLRHPTALVSFQERIVTEGGTYWDDVADRSDDLTRSFEQGKLALDELFAADATSNSKPAGKAIPKAVPSSVAKRTGGQGYKLWAFVSSGIAACLAVAVTYLLLQPGTTISPVRKEPIAWGWGKPTGLALDETTAQGYLNKLASTAEEWSQDRPIEAVAVGLRLNEFRAGCTRLMHSTYGPLTPEDKAWLLEKCRAWAKKLDEHQQALDAGANPIEVRTAVDETVQKLANTLREKAKQVG